MFTNPCGGLRYRALPNGLIELEGQGTPAYEPGSARHVLLEQTLANWRPFFRRSASHHGLPVSWLAAIAAVETGPWSASPEGQATIRSPVGAIGIMQIMPATATMLGFRPDEMLDPQLNIEAGAMLIAQLAERSDGLPAITGRYNSGKLCCSDPRCGADCTNPFGFCTDSDYPGAAVRYNNAAVLLGVNDSSSHLMMGLGMAAAGLYVAAVISGQARLHPALARFTR
jgi:soluble lytic murein transglycosylase-like protein